MTSFCEQYSDEESDLVRGFSYGGSCCSVQCHCGRTYFTTAPTGGDWEQGELDRLIEREEADPNQFVGTGLFDTIDTVLIEGKEFVPQCKCDGVRKYLDFMNAHFEQLTRFCLNRLERERKAAEAKVRQSRAMLERFKTKRLPVGTKVKFIKDLIEPANEEHPSLLFAVKYQAAIVNGYCCHEGHMVQVEGRPPFGASYGTEFIESEATDER